MELLISSKRAQGGESALAQYNTVKKRLTAIDNKICQSSALRERNDGALSPVQSCFEDVFH
jgi:hypothetical protein